MSIEAPQDKELAKLGVEINKTYCAFGAEGVSGATRQEAQDKNVATLSVASGAVAQRAVAKASVNYRNSSWDLVDAVKEKKADLGTLKAEDLPAEMQKLTVKEREVYIETKSKERAEMQAKIGELNREREKYVASRMKEIAGTNTLDAVVISAVREQSAKRNFKFE